MDVKECQALVVSERWLSKIQESDSGCHLWIAFVTPDGYPKIKMGAFQARAHRVSLVAAMGRDIAYGMEVGHRCHDLAFAEGECTGGVCLHRRCVNPDHLVEQSRRENLLSGDTPAANRAARTHCPRGHELSRDNSLKRIGRACKECGKERAATISAAHKVLGMTRREYANAYGYSLATAQAIVAKETETCR